MAGHHLTDAYLATLRRSLPADAVDELADGLTETYQHHLDGGRSPDEAATTAIADFGTPGQITAAFTRHAPGRRAARILLATGPAVGACWGISLVMARFWTWPVPTTATLTTAAGLLVVVAILLAAATSRREYRRTRIAAIGAAGPTTTGSPLLHRSWVGPRPTDMPDVGGVITDVGDIRKPAAWLHPTG